MSIFDLLFLSLALITAISLCAVAGFAITGRRKHSIHILTRLVIGGSLYFTIVVVVSLLAPRRTFNLGDTQCFDDWCIAATSAQQTGNSVVVGLRISSRARRVSQRERNLNLYLVDRQKHRYISESSDSLLSSLLLPGQSLDLTRTFTIPPAAKDLNLVITHGGFPIGWFIIGYNSWFRPPPLIHLRSPNNSF
jgi:hypothetical protein